MNFFLSTQDEVFAKHYSGAPCSVLCIGIMVCSVIQITTDHTVSSSELTWAVTKLSYQLALSGPTSSTTTISLTTSQVWYHPTMAIILLLLVLLVLLLVLHLDHHCSFSMTSCLSVTLSLSLSPTVSVSLSERV